MVIRLSLYLDSFKLRESRSAEIVKSNGKDVWEDSSQTRTTSHKLKTNKGQDSGPTKKPFSFKTEP